MDADLGLLYAVTVIGYLATIPWTRLWAKRLRLPEAEPWGISDERR